jgi:hypothetical protein
MDPKYVGMLFVLAGWGIGGRIGWHLMDRHIKRRNAAREATMKNITPRREN